MAIYNNGLPLTYPQMNYNVNEQMIQQLQAQQPQAQTDMKWVQGEAAAKAYPVARNSSVTLFDSETDLFYIKTADASGMPQKIRMFRYVEVTDGEEVEDKNPVITEQSVQYATKTDLQNVNDSIIELSKQINSLIQIQNTSNNTEKNTQKPVTKGKAVGKS